MWVQSLDWEDPLEEGMATHSNILAWRIPWREEPGWLQSVGLQRVGHNWSDIDLLVFCIYSGYQNFLLGFGNMVVINAHPLPVFRKLSVLHRCVLNHFSPVWLLEILWTAIPLSRGFSMQKYWSGLSCPPPGDLPNPGIEPASLVSPALAGRFFTASATWESPLGNFHLEMLT